MILRLNSRSLDLPADLASVEDRELRNFLLEWFDERNYVVGRTSGSTGIPKEIRLSKEDMRASARITNAFFGIGKESFLLLCLSVSYIAGKMMVVRALEAGAELWSLPVSSHPLRKLTGAGSSSGKEITNTGMKIDLAAMVPLQVEETLKIEEEKKALSAVRQLLIGGAPVSSRLEKRLQAFPVCCYATYGMTETVSHVALRRLNGQPAYTAIGGVEFSVDRRGCLVIYAPHLEAKKFITNDWVKLIDSRHFIWLGRYDHVINSGGIKFSPEVIESKIAGCISRRYYITSVPDDRLGERIVLVIEGEAGDKRFTERLLADLGRFLSAYEMPKEVRYIPHFEETPTGKVIRNHSLPIVLAFRCDDENRQT